MFKIFSIILKTELFCLVDFLTAGGKRECVDKGGYVVWKQLYTYTLKLIDNCDVNQALHIAPCTLHLAPFTYCTLLYNVFILGQKFVLLFCLIWHLSDVVSLVRNRGKEGTLSENHWTWMWHDLDIVLQVEKTFISYKVKQVKKGIQKKMGIERKWIYAWIEGQKYNGQSSAKSHVL